MSADIFDRLIEQGTCYSDGHGLLHQEAADEIARLSDRIERLEAALREVADWYRLYWGDRPFPIEKIEALLAKQGEKA
jgi:hypothetical protein